MRGTILRLFGIGLLLFGMSATVTRGDDKPTTRVAGSFLIPKTVASFDKHFVEIQLFQYDPRIADKAADLVEGLEIKQFSHTQGTDTRQRFVIGEKGTLDGQMAYYLTCFILKDGTRTHIGECTHAKKNICGVLTNGKPKTVEITVRNVN